MFKLLVIGSGGFCGAVLRYLISGVVQNASGSIGFPFGTFAVNLLGCLGIGLLSQLMESRGVFSADVRWFLLIGFLGSFTTYSTFGNETLNLMRQSKILYASIYVGIHIVLCIGAVWLGRGLAQSIWR